MALTSPQCGTSFSQVRSQDIVILMCKAKYDNNGKLIPPAITDMYLPPTYSKVSDNPNAKLDTNTVANSKETRSDLINYDSELKFTIIHEQVGAFGKEINSFIKEQAINNRANWVVWEIHGVSNPVIDSDSQLFIGDGFEVKQWHGPLTSNHYWAMGDDGKMIEREFTLKNKGCAQEFELKDASLAPLIGTWLKGIHWLSAGLWDNESPARITSSTASTGTSTII